MTQIEARTSDDTGTTGFAYTSRTRMGFSPKATVTRREEDHKSTDLVIWAASGHPEPTRADIVEIVHALATQHPDRRIAVLAEGGLVPLFEPDKPAVAATAAERPIRAIGG